MTVISTNSPTAELQALDALHHMHPFSANAPLGEKGARVITRGEGAWLTDSEGERILDAMAGLWCVNIGYGRDELADVAARQMRELPFYNTFFHTTHVPAIQLAAKLAEIVPGNLNNVFFASGGSDANDTNIRMARHYWSAKGKPSKNVIISRKNAYHGSTIGGASLGGMVPMHQQGSLPIPDIEHIGQPNWWAEGGDTSPEEFGLARARELEAKIEELGDHSEEESRRTLHLLDMMIQDLDLLNKSGEDNCPPEYLARTWCEDMVWYGPAGIGATYTIPRYQQQHQYPFREGLTDKVYNGHVSRFAEGNYACFFGWPNLSHKPTGGFMGLPGGESTHMRVVDVYRREGDKLLENWVLIDIPYWLKQQGLDVLERTRSILNP